MMGMHITINTVDLCMDLPVCLTADEIRIVTLEDEHLGALAELIFHGWLSTRAWVQRELQPYWAFREKIAIIDGIPIKGRRIIIPTTLQDKALKQPYGHRKDKDANM